jgi:hypothetical protein
MALGVSVFYILGIHSITITNSALLLSFGRMMNEERNWENSLDSGNVRKGFFVTVWERPRHFLDRWDRMNTMNG